MSEAPNAFVDLMESVKRGDHEAETQLVCCYGDHLARSICRHLKRIKALRSQFDPDDFFQIVWADFFASLAQRKQFVTNEQFMRFLSRMARNQILKATRSYLDAPKRDLRRRRHLSDPNTAAVALAIADPQPTPAEAVEVNDTCERWLQSLSSEERQAVLMMRDGFCWQDIAEKLGCSVRTVERIVHKIRWLLHRLNERGRDCRSASGSPK